MRMGQPPDMYTCASASVLPGQMPESIPTAPDTLWTTESLRRRDDRLRPPAAEPLAAGGDHPGGEVTQWSTAYLGRLGSILAFVQVERLRTRTYTCQAAVPFAFSCQCSPAKCRQPGPRRLLEPGQPLTTGRPRRPAAGVDCPVRK